MRPNIVIGLPTIGRAAILCRTLTQLRCQTRLPDGIMVCGTRPADVEGAEQAYPSAKLLYTTAGLPRQRNAILAGAANADVVMFFDDDFLPHPNYLAAVEQYMTANPSCVVATGKVLADGINGPGLTLDEALSIIARHGEGGPSATPVFTAYGCNMAVRTAPMRLHGLHFDERLPLYGWQEDVDLSRQLAVFGAVVQLDGARGVHLGVKSGRCAGIRLGYSQVANPLYLSAKRRGYPFGRAVGHIAKNVAMNVARAAWSEPYTDRRGRLRGNVLAFRDLMRGRIVPERILDL
jgi:GT2 family glycosyltransferase